MTNLVHPDGAVCLIRAFIAMAKQYTCGHKCDSCSTIQKIVDLFQSVAPEDTDKSQSNENKVKTKCCCT